MLQHRYAHALEWSRHKSTCSGLGKDHVLDEQMLKHCLQGGSYLTQLSHHQHHLHIRKSSQICDLNMIYCWNANMCEMYTFEHISGLQGNKMPTFHSGNLAEKTKSRIEAASHFCFLILPSNNGWTAFTVHVTGKNSQTNNRKNRKRKHERNRTDILRYLDLGKIDIVFHEDFFLFVCKSQSVFLVPVKQPSHGLLRDGGGQVFFLKISSLNASKHTQIVPIIEEAFKIPIKRAVM